MHYFQKISGQVLYLSPLSINDALTYTKWLNDKTISESLGIDGSIVTLEFEQKWIEENQNNFMFSIVLKESNELIGSCGFKKIDLLHQNGTLSMFIGEEGKRGKGYGREALKLLLNYGFNNLNLNNINLSVFSFNTKVKKFYESLGFKTCGTKHKCHYLRGKYYDEIQMEILKDEYSEIEPFIYV